MSARWVEHAFAPHMHDFYAISLNYGGRGAFECRRERRDALPGTCNLIAPGELHTGRAASEEGWSYRNLHIEARRMAIFLESLGWQRPLEVRFRFPLVSDTVLATRLTRVFACLAKSGSLLENESLILSAVERLVTDHVEHGHALRDPGSEHAAVARVKEWLDANSEQNVSLDRLASIAGLSPYYLVRVFHKHVGIPPYKYQAVVRTNRARKLLASGAAISEVAYRTGFCDQSHLHRVFKKTFGVTPGRYAAGRVHR